MAMGDPTGEADRGALRLDFDRRLLLQFRGSAITSDAGLLTYRELDDTLRLTDTGADTLADARTADRGERPARGTELVLLAGRNGGARPQAGQGGVSRKLGLCVTGGLRALPRLVAGLPAVRRSTCPRSTT